MTQHPIDKLFQDKLKNFEQTPSFNAWDKLENLLDNSQKAQIKNKRKIPFWAIAACITLLIATTTLFIFYQKDTNNQVAIVKKNIQVLSKENNHPKKVEVPTKEKNEEIIKQEEVVIKENKNIKSQIKLNKETEILKKNEPEQKVEKIEEENIRTNLETPAHQPVELAQEQKKAKDDEPVKVVVTVKLAPRGNLAQNNNKNKDLIAKAGTVVNELMNLKNGEEVNYKALGIEKGKALSFLSKE